MVRHAPCEQRGSVSRFRAASGSHPALTRARCRLPPPRQAETIAGDKDKADGGLGVMEALSLPLSAASSASQAASQAADGAGPSAGGVIGGAAVKLSASDREVTLEAFVREMWLISDERKSFFQLGPRAFLELGNYLLDVAAEDVREMWAARV